MGQQIDSFFTIFCRDDFESGFFKNPFEYGQNDRVIIGNQNFPALGIHAVILRVLFLDFEMDPAIGSPGRFIMTWIGRFFFAIAYR